MKKRWFPLLILLLLGTQPAIASGLEKFSPWKGRRFVNTSDFQLVRLKKGARSTSIPIQLEVSQKGVWLRVQHRRGGTLRFVRKFLFPLWYGQIPATLKAGRKKNSFLVPRLKKALLKARQELQKDLRLRRFDFLHITSDSRTLKLVESFALLLDHRISYRTMTELLFNAGQAGLNKFLFAGCVRRKNNPCSLRYLPVIAPEIKAPKLLDGDLKRLKSWKNLKSLLTSPKKLPLNLMLQLSSSALHLVLRNTPLRGGCPIQKQLKGAALTGKKTNFLSKQRLNTRLLSRCLLSLKKLEPSVKHYIFSSQPSVHWSKVARILEAARIRVRTRLILPDVIFSVVI